MSVRWLKENEGGYFYLEIEAFWSCEFCVILLAFYEWGASYYILVARVCQGCVVNMKKCGCQVEVLRSWRSHTSG